MSFLKKILSKTDKTQNIFSPEILSATRIYPVLKPGDWVGLQYGGIHKIIVGITEKPELILSYGYDFEEQSVFVTNELLNGKTEQEIEAEAMKNLKEFKSEIKEVVPGKVIICDNGEYCSEKILDKEFMLELHRILNAQELLVSISRRRNLMAISLHEAEDAFMNKFMDVHTGVWNDDSYGNAQITNTLIVVKNGLVDRVVKMENQNINSV